MNKDKINPAHYKATDGSDYQVIDFIEEYDLFDFRLGNATKYLCRAGKKEGETINVDTKKALWYINRYLLNINLYHKSQPFSVISLFKEIFSDERKFKGKMYSTDQILVDLHRLGVVDENIKEVIISMIHSRYVETREAKFYITRAKVRLEDILEFSN